MSETKRPPSNKGASGEHPAVKAYREKLESISDNEEAELDQVLERIERLKRKSDNPPKDEEKKDPRRDGEEEVPVDVVELEKHPDPFPNQEKAKE